MELATFETSSFSREQFCNVFKQLLGQLSQIFANTRLQALVCRVKNTLTVSSSWFKSISFLTKAAGVESGVLQETTHSWPLTTSRQMLIWWRSLTTGNMTIMELKSECPGYLEPNWRRRETLLVIANGELWLVITCFDDCYRGLYANRFLSRDGPLQM